MEHHVARLSCEVAEDALWLAVTASTTSMFEFKFQNQQHTMTTL